MIKRRIVITGLGTITAAGNDRKTFWETIQRGIPLFSPITRFTSPAPQGRLAAQAADFQAEGWMAKPMTRKTDRSTQFALAASSLALIDSGIHLAEFDPLKVGVMVGTAVGGMDFAETQLHNQAVHGPSKVSPHLVVAWFHVASQGRISIAHGIKGYSKTFITDRVSSLHAIGHGYKSLRNGKLDLCLAGGTEAPLAPFIYAALERTGQLGKERYAPFQKEATGFLLGEGSAFMVMEELDRALARRATILAEVKGYAMTTDPTAGLIGLSGPKSMVRTIQMAMQEANVRKGEIGHVLADGVASATGDAAEAMALMEALGEDRDWTVSVPKTVVGELYGAGGAIQTAAGVLSLQHQTTLPLKDACDIPHSNVPCPRPLSNILVMGRGLGGLSSCLILGKWDPLMDQESGSLKGLAQAG